MNLTLKSFLKFNFLAFLALTLIHCQQPQKTTKEPTASKIEFLRSFAKVYGYVKYFHPADEASSIDWDKFAVYGAEEIEKCSSDKELMAVLGQLFKPIAPSIKFYEKDKAREYDLSGITPRDMGNFEPTFWQHLGVAPPKANKYIPYYSIRANRGLNKDSLRLFEENLVFGEMIEKEIGNNVVCQIPLVLYANREHTFPKADENSLSQLQNKLEKIRPKGSDLNLRLGNVINLYNVFQHFYPYMEVLDLDWEELLRTALKRSYGDKDITDHVSTLMKFTAPLKDGHIEFTSRSNLSNFEGGWESYVPPINWEWLGDDLVITNVYDTGLPIKVGDVVSAIDHGNPREFFEAVHSKISGNQGWVDYKARTLSLLGEKGAEILLTIDNRDIVLKHKTHINNSELLRSPYIPDRLYINDSVTYINLTRLDVENLQGMLGILEKSKSIICDLRGYPNGGMHKLISLFLKEKDTAKGFMKVPKIVYPDQDKMLGYNEYQWFLEEEKPYLGDKRIIFITDGSAISYSESIMIFIKGYKLGTIIGQPTAGADGNKNTTELAGDISFYWTGMKMTNLDGSRLHGIGVLPDIYVTKSIEGFKAGKDEFLEKAIELTKNKDHLGTRTSEIN